MLHAAQFLRFGGFSQMREKIYIDAFAGKTSSHLSLVLACIDYASAI